MLLNLTEKELFLSTRSVLWIIICRKCVCGLDSALDHTGGAQDAPPDPLAGWRGDTSPHTRPLPYTPSPRRLRRLDFRASGTRVCPYTYFLATPLGQRMPKVHSGEETLPKSSTT